MEESLTINQVAELLEVHYNTVYRWIITGLLPYFKLGGQYRITRKDLQEFTKVIRSKDNGDEISKKVTLQEP